MKCFEVMEPSRPASGPTALPAGRVTLGKLATLSEPAFPPVWKEGEDNSFFLDTGTPGRPRAWLQHTVGRWGLGPDVPPPVTGHAATALPRGLTGVRAPLGARREPDTPGAPEQLGVHLVWEPENVKGPYVVLFKTKAKTY